MNFQSGSVVVTGSLGFIGSHLTLELLSRGYRVLGIDRADISSVLSAHHLARFREVGDYQHRTLDLAETQALESLWLEHAPSVVFHLAARAGVRSSWERPDQTYKDNVLATLSLLKSLQGSTAERLLYASSSSVYGDQPGPWDESLMRLASSPYAASKVAMEDLVELYTPMLELDAIGMRFFTVYGPYGRVDMAPFLFASGLLLDQPLTLYGDGQQLRDFTPVSFVAQSMLALMDLPHTSSHILYNIGSSDPLSISDMLHLLAESLQIEPKIFYDGPRLSGDALQTYADTGRLQSDLGPHVLLSHDEGFRAYAQWLRNHTDLYPETFS